MADHKEGIGYAAGVEDDNDDPTFEELERSELVNVPKYYPVSFDISVTSNEIIVLNNETNMIIFNGRPSSFVKMHPAFILKLSPGSAKDLTQALFNAVRSYEEQYGKITTDAMLQGKQEK